MAKTSSRPNSTISSDSDNPIGVSSRFGSGKWRMSNQVSGTRFKVCLAGRKNVGKTSIFLRLQNLDFCKEKPTSSTLTYEYLNSNDPTVEYSVWDTNYDETDSLTLGDHYRNAHCIVLIYDVTDFKSLEYVNYELEKIEKQQYAPHTKYVLLQNKVDVKASKHIPSQKQKEYVEGSLLRKKLDLFVPVSAKSNEGIKEFFYTDLPELLTLPGDGENKPMFGRYLEENDSTNKRKKKKRQCNPM